MTTSLAAVCVAYDCSGCSIRTGHCRFIHTSTFQRDIRAGWTPTSRGSYTSSSTTRAIAATVRSENCSRSADCSLPSRSQWESDPSSPSVSAPSGTPSRKGAIGSLVTRPFARLPPPRNAARGRRSRLSREVEVEPAFVETYFGGQPEERTEQFVETANDLDDLARERAGKPFAVLSPEERTALFREVGVGRTAPDPNGTVPERVRYHLVNGLLYALYTSPTGSSLFGVTNPVGHPGGYSSYRAKPQQ